MAKDKIQFIACLKQTGAAISFDSDGVGKIVLETDGSQMTKAGLMLALIGATFKVTIEKEGE